MMVASKALMVLYIFFCKTNQVLLFQRCLERPGVAKCSGRVWTEPAPIIQMGQTISINCHYNTEPCQEAKLHLLLNGSLQNRLSVINKSTVQLQLHNYTKPFFNPVRCYASCPDKASLMLICGTQFCVGDLPDKPANLTCNIYEFSKNMVCKWNPGKETHLSTSYTLYLRSLQKEGIQSFSSNNDSCTIPLNQLQKNQTFAVCVCAENYLGTVRSDQLYIDPKDTVIPATPIITEHNTVDSPVFKTIIQWQKRTAINETYCEERYKEATSKTWHAREWETDFKRQYRTEYHLDANTKYEFQVRCRLTHTGSVWSQWSNSTTYMTPEAEPSSVLDVWRHLGPVYKNGSQEMTVLIKPFHPKESRGRILDYSVFWENQGQIVNLHNTTETKCKVLVPAAVTTVYVTARNSKGSSKPANITMNQQPHNDHDFPSPTNMTIIHDGQNGIFVTWEPPKPIGKLVLWYIVEWTSGDWQDHYHHDTVWKKVPIHNTTTYIQGDIGTEQSLNISVYAVYQGGDSKACSVQSFSKDKYRLVQLLLIHKSRKCNCTANPIPTGAQNAGLLIQQLYPVNQQGTGPTRIVLVKKRQEGLADNYLESTSAAIDDDEQENDVGLLLGIGTVVASLSIFLLILIAKKSCRKRVSTACISVTPKWLFEDYPKVQNSSAIKSLQEKNGSVTYNSTRLFLDYEDVAITEVEETLLHTALEEDNNESREAVSEQGNSSQEVLSVNNSVIIEENGYKPQVSSTILLGSVFCSSPHEIHSQNPDTKSNPPASSMKNVIKDYKSPMASIWPIAGTEENTFSLETMSLVLNNSRSGRSNVVSLTDEEPNIPMENLWQFSQSDDNTQEQTLIPNELLSCLGVVNEDSTAIISYFPQSIAK